MVVAQDVHTCAYITESDSKGKQGSKAYAQQVPRASDNERERGEGESSKGKCSYSDSDESPDLLRLDRVEPMLLHIRLSQPSPPSAPPLPR